MEATATICKSKLITDENVNLTACRKAIRSIRNCQHCSRRSEVNCKHCVPRPVVDECMTAITFYFRFLKQNKKLSIVDNKKTSTEDIESVVNTIGEVENYNI